MTASPEYELARDNLARQIEAVRDYMQRNGLMPERKAVGLETRYTNNLKEIAKADTSESDKRDAIIALLALYALLAYQEGMLRGGSPNPEIEMTAEDKAAVDAWLAIQVGFAAGVATAMAKAKKLEKELDGGPDQQAKLEQAQFEVDRRIGLWGATLAVLQLSGFASAHDPFVTWRVDPSKEHCKPLSGKITCLDLDGQRHPLSWFLDKGYIPREPDSSTLACGGWKCGCGLFVDGGRQVM